MNTSLPVDAVAAWQALPESVRCPPASLQQIESFEEQHGPIPPGFRAFLLECGGGVVGTEWVDGIEQLGPTQAKFEHECGVPGGWSMRGVFVIGWDGAGNPIALDQSGAVIVEDHTFGGVHVLASSFQEFFVRGMTHAL